MPGGDGTGPFGTGGYCTPLLQSGQIQAPLRRGFGTGIGLGGGMGFGRGFGRRGYRRMFYATGLPGWVRFGTATPALPAQPTQVPPAPIAPLSQQTKDQEIQSLEQEKIRLEQDLQNIDKRLEELRK